MALARTTGFAVSLGGVGLVAAGLWGRREVRSGLERERIVGTADSTPPNAPVATGPAARSLAESIRRATVTAAGGRTYAETEPYLDAGRNPTSDRAQALEDERTGEPVGNPAVALWLQSTTLQTALMQAYMAARIADLTVGLGVAFVAVGIGLAAAGRAEG